MIARPEANTDLLDGGVAGSTQTCWIDSEPESDAIYLIHDGKQGEEVEKTRSMMAGQRPMRTMTMACKGMS